MIRGFLPEVDVIELQEATEITRQPALQRGVVELVSRRATPVRVGSADDPLAGRLQSLPPCAERCVIINVHTDELASLAAHSASRFGITNLLLINCDPPPSSRERLRALGRDLAAAVLEAPTRRHWQMLDLLFLNLRDETILLMDSDAELKTNVVERMREEMRAPDVYGSGWINGPSWLAGVFGNDAHSSARTGWYLQRPWIPFALFKREIIARALAGGTSFRDGVIPNDLPSLRVTNRLLLARFKVPGLRRLRLTPLERARREYDRVRPNYCYADTGAILHHVLLAQGMRFAGPEAPEPNQTSEIAHRFGATRLRSQRPHRDQSLETR